MKKPTIEIKVINNTDKFTYRTEPGQEKVLLVPILFETGDRKLDITLEIAKKSRLHFIAVCFLKGKSNLVLNTYQLHREEEGFSDLLCKSVVADDARFAYRGTIKIDPSGQKSHAYQRDENLLLGQGSMVESEPNLEILANEVFCTHGATTGYLDEEQVFYLESRGLDRKKIEEMLSLGFLTGAFDKLVGLGVDLKVIDGLQSELQDRIVKGQNTK